MGFPGGMGFRSFLGGGIGIRWGLRSPKDGISRRKGVDRMLKIYTGMQTWWADLKGRVTEERGATAVEYALMVALIAVVIIAAVTFIGNSASDKFHTVGQAVNDAGS
jgi:pilus assembly protein Flp/PilA